MWDLCRTCLTCSSDIIVNVNEDDRTRQSHTLRLSATDEALVQVD